MKKMISLLAACALCGSLLAALPVSAEETATRKTGDVNGDGIINLDDAYFTQVYYANSILNMEDELMSRYADAGYDIILENADANKDGLIDIDDTHIIMKYFAKDILGDAPDTIEEMMAAYKK